MKLYNEKEIGAILKKAAENSSGDNADTSMGLSVDELQQLASDAGIDPDQIIKAISEIELASVKDDKSFWGGPFSFSSQMVVDGEITAGEWEEILASIREYFKAKGDVSTRESVMEWSSPWGSSNSAHVTALKENGKTKINVFWNGPLTALPFYLPVPLAAIASIPFASEFLELTAVPGISFVLLMSGVAFTIGRWALRRHLDKIFGKFRQMMSGFEKITSKNESKGQIISKEDATIQSQMVSHEPILEIGEEEGSDESQLRTKSRDRS